MLVEYFSSLVRYTYIKYIISKAILHSVFMLKSIRLDRYKFGRLESDLCPADCHGSYDIVMTIMQ